MRHINVLDVTLRDGGCVIDFNFGQTYMDKILEAQENAGIEIVELGYIDEKKGSINGRTQYINEQIIPKCILKKKNPNTLYVAMIDYGKYDISKLKTKTEKDIDGIRIAFHKANRFDVIPIAKEIMSKGYRFYIQPMVTFRYSDAELLEYIKIINREIPEASGFYVVDSFGEMRPNDVQRILKLINDNLIDSMTIGFHSHNNLQLSYSNAMAVLQFPTHRDLILDCSIMGMGKGAGNLNTELLLEHLNLFYKKKYRISPLLKVIDEVLNQIRAESYWGYAPEYYLSSANHCTPSYASFFYNKHMLPINQVGELLSLIKEDKKLSFDKTYAEDLYLNYNNSNKVNDEVVVSELQGALNNKMVLLVAPGKSLNGATKILEAYCNKQDMVSIGINIVNSYKLDYYLITKTDLYRKAVKKLPSVIITSNVVVGEEKKVKKINYANWITREEKIQDSAATIIFNLLRKCNIRGIYLIGFDGFSPNINDNYYNSSLRRPVTEKEALQRNNNMKSLIRSMRDNGIPIIFLTDSLYELP